MKINFTFQNIVAFLAILFICHELHEISHTAVARLQCGCWGQRDFNVWEICNACSREANTLLATVAGPLFTYALIWAGYFLMLKKAGPSYQSLGWVLVFANKPFARIFTVLMKGGDETVITRSLFNQQSLSPATWILEISVVLMFIVPPLIKAWKLLKPGNRLLLFIAFLILPMLIEYVLLHKLGNNLLQNGILNQQGILGSPVLVNLWTGLWLIVLLLTWKRLFKWMVNTGGN